MMMMDGQGRYHHVDERLVGNDCTVLVGTVCGRLSVAIGGGWAKDENDMTMNSKRMNIMQWYGMAWLIIALSLLYGDTMVLGLNGWLARARKEKLRLRRHIANFIHFTRHEDRKMLKIAPLPCVFIPIIPCQASYQCVVLSPWLLLSLVHERQQSVVEP